MFSIFPVSVVEENNEIKISNFKVKKFILDVIKVYGTTRITNSIFKATTGSMLKIDSFYALELYHMLDELLVNRKRRLLDVKTITKVKELLLTKTWLSKIEKEHPSVLDRSRLSLFKFDPLKHQDEFLTFYDKTTVKYGLNGLPLAAAPGSGKTATSLMLAECVHASKIVVIAPLVSVDRVWYNSCGHDNKDLIYRSIVPTYVYSHGKPYNNERILVFHYEALGKAIDMLDKFKVDNSIIILDESHNLNETNSLRTALFGTLCKELKPRHTIMMSGTPFKAEMREAIPYLRVIDPLFTEEVEESFKKVFAGNVTKATEILSRRLNAISFKVAKSRLGLDEPVEETISLTMHGSEKFTLKTISAEMLRYSIDRTKELYKDREMLYDDYFVFINDIKESRKTSLPSSTNRTLEYDFAEYKKIVDRIFELHEINGLAQAKELLPAATKFEKTQIIPFITDKRTKDWFMETKTVIKYPKLKVRGECLGRILGRKRIEAHVELAKQIPFEDIIQSSEKKTVIFSSYIEVLESAAAMLKNSNYQHLAVYGKYTSDLANLVSKFEKYEHFNPLIATYASLSTAVPLTMADTMILINPPFRDYILQQTIARIHRIGADTQTRIFHIVLDTGEEPNISSRNIDILKWSKDQVDQILNVGESTELKDDENLALESLAIEELTDYIHHVPLVDMQIRPKMLTW